VHRRRESVTKAPDEFTNVYADAERAAAYSRLAFPGTYWLAFRDVPAMLKEHVRGHAVLDFGCGTGRSTRFLRDHGFDVTGVDISGEMIDRARALDPSGAYIQIADGDFAAIRDRRFDLVFCAFTFDNIPGPDHRAALLRGLRDLLTATGRIVMIASTAEIYQYEWASFSTNAFPENAHADSGDSVRIVMKDVPDSRPVVDILWQDWDYTELFDESGLELVTEHRPLGRADEPIAWITERTIAPWVIYVLAALTALTVAQRMLHVRKQLNSKMEG